MAQNTNKKTQNENSVSMTTEEMLGMIKKLQEQVATLTNDVGKTEVKAEKASKAKETINKVESNTTPLSGDDDITVVNLCEDGYALSTLGYGNGKIYTFSTYGYERDIPYNDLKECIHANRDHIEGGRVYIKDERVIKKFRLQDYYKTMLDKDAIDNLKKLEPKKLYDVLTHLPVAETNTINSGNEPKQFDIAFRHIMRGIRNGEYSVEQIAQVENAYREVNKNKGKTININEEIDFANEVGIDITKQ